MSTKAYTIQGIYTDGTLNDIEAQLPNKTIVMLGSGGAVREQNCIQLPATPCLPVLLGSGMGYALDALLMQHDGPVAVVDKEADIMAYTMLSERYQEQASRVTFICDDTIDAAMHHLTIWQGEHDGLPFAPCAHPFYLRLDKTYYSELRQRLQHAARVDFWNKARKPRFTHEKPRLLLITSQFFLMGELIEACTRLDLPYHLLTLPNDSIASDVFITELLTAVVDFEPDCIITINHLGVDKEGVLIDLLAKLQLPLASWFVDNPHLILHLYQCLVSPWTSIFTWDADNISSLHQMGFEHVFHLPLGTATHRFTPIEHAPQQWQTPISFVGNSMVYKVGARLKAGGFPRELLLNFRRVAAAFGDSDERSASGFLRTAFPELYPIYDALQSNERKLAFETAITWEATRQYRKQCVGQILPFSPLLVGDAGWKITFRHEEHPPKYHEELNYYSELPKFYPFSDINFNCTSKQMKGAVNQRVFDVPAAGAFVLTDWREQMDALFEPQKEIIFYREPDEIPELATYYLTHPAERTRVAQAARKRVLACHTWEHRILQMLEQLRQTYGIAKASA